MDNQMNIQMNIQSILSGIKEMYFDSTTVNLRLLFISIIVVIVALILFEKKYRIVGSVTFLIGFYSITRSVTLVLTELHIIETIPVILQKIFLLG